LKKANALEDLKKSAIQLKEGCLMIIKNVLPSAQSLVTILGISINLGLFSINLADWSS
jgi:hypothetical protein